MQSFIKAEIPMNELLNKRKPPVMPKMANKSNHRHARNSDLAVLA